MAIIVIIIVVVVIAVAAYVVLSNNNNDDNNDGNNDNGGDTIEERTMAPGTLMAYDTVLEGEAITAHMTFIGQNADEYFCELKLLTETADLIQYTVLSKDLSADENAEKINNISLATSNYGNKDVEVWKLTDNTNGVNEITFMYIDPSDGLIYRMIDGEGETAVVFDLKDHEVVWQTSYEESDAIGMTYEYSGTLASKEYTTSIKCIADCLEDRYGVSYGDSIYFVSNYPQGLPTYAEKKTETTTLTDTIDGDVDVEIWEFNGIGGIKNTYYYDPVSHVIYRLIMPNTNGEDVTLELVRKPA
jgi:hypothetical protein